MRRVIAACLLLVLLPGIVLGAAFLSPPVYAQTYYGELGEMYRHLRNVEGPKLVVIGNSGVAFGVDGAVLERELRACGTEYTVCNFGLYGAIGSKAMLDLALDTIGEGDLVVFAPEADNRACSLFFSGAELWRSIDSERSLLPALWRSNASGLLGSFVGYVQEKQDILARRGTAAVDAVYARSSFDEDCVLRYASRPQNIMPGGYDETTPISFSDVFSDGAFTDYLNSYAGKLRKRGAAFCLSFSPMNERALGEDADPEAFFDELYERLDFPVISNPRNMILDACWFYDSNFHMNEAGMTAYTMILLADIKNLLGLPQKSATPVPNPPELAETVRTTFSGDNSQADCYTYEPFEDGWQITGLNEKGASLTALMIPSAYEEKPVHRFTASAFAGRKTIVSVTVQENVGTILDGSFQGCTSMERLILSQNDPASIRVGYGLTEGSSFRIYVPAAAFSAYANNYFWGFYNDGRLVSYEE